MASSSESSEAAESGASRFARRLQSHERVPRVDLAAGAARANPTSYARFIPREELGSAMAWVPASLDRPMADRGGPAARPPAAAAPPEPDPAALRAARQAQWQARLAEVFEQGRQAGHDELAAQAQARIDEAVEAFRRQQAEEVGAPVAALLTAFRQGLDGVEQSLAQRIAGIAMQMARQVVRSELQTRAALVVDVVQEALDEVLLSARHIVVKVHPEDLRWIEQGCRDVVEARGARLVADAHLERGGCLVESDLGVVDARLATRWASAVAAMGAPPLAEVDRIDGSITP